MAGLNHAKVPAIKDEHGSLRVRLLIHVLRQSKFFFASLLSAIAVYLPRSCLVRTGIALMGKPSICDPQIVSFSRSNAR